MIDPYDPDYIEDQRNYERAQRKKAEEEIVFLRREVERHVKEKNRLREHVAELTSERDGLESERDHYRKAEQFLINRVKELEEKYEHVNELMAGEESLRVHQTERRLAAAERELERWRHGVQIEGDFVCPDSLSLSELQRLLLERADVLKDALGRDPHFLKAAVYRTEHILREAANED